MPLECLNEYKYYEEKVMFGAQSPTFFASKKYISACYAQLKYLKLKNIWICEAKQKMVFYSKHVSCTQKQSHFTNAEKIPIFLFAPFKFVCAFTLEIHGTDFKTSALFTYDRPIRGGVNRARLFFKPFAYVR